MLEEHSTYHLSPQNKPEGVKVRAVTLSSKENTAGTEASAGHRSTDRQGQLSYPSPPGAQTGLDKSQDGVWELEAGPHVLPLGLPGRPCT